MLCEQKGWRTDHRNSATTYETLSQLLTDIFLSSAWRNFHKTAIRDGIQRPDEDVTTYLSAFRSLGRNAYPTMQLRYRNEHLRAHDKFIVGIGLKPHIRLFLRTQLAARQFDECITAVTR